jgi:hypothetical protein
MCREVQNILNIINWLQDYINLYHQKYQPSESDTKGITRIAHEAELTRLSQLIKELPPRWGQAFVNYRTEGRLYQLYAAVNT